MSKPFVFLAGAASSALIVWLAMFVFWITPLRREHSRMRDAITASAEQLTLDAIAAAKSDSAQTAAQAMQRNADRMREAARYVAGSALDYETSGK